MRVWFISPALSEEYGGNYNDAEPGDSCGEDTCDIEYCTVCYQYETDYEPLFSESKLYATEAQAIKARNEELFSSYEKERKAHADRTKRYHAKREAIELLALSGLDPEDLYPYGIGDEPKFSIPRPWRVGYLEVEEES